MNTALISFTGGTAQLDFVHSIVAEIPLTVIAAHQAQKDFTLENCVLDIFMEVKW